MVVRAIEPIAVIFKSDVEVILLPGSLCALFNYVRRYSFKLTRRILITLHIRFRKSQNTVNLDFHNESFFTSGQ